MKDTRQIGFSPLSAPLGQATRLLLKIAFKSRFQPTGLPFTHAKLQLFSVNRSAGISGLSRFHGSSLAKRSVSYLTKLAGRFAGT